MAIDKSVNKSLKKFDFKIRCSVHGSGSGRGSYVKSNVTCHKCGKKDHANKYFRSKGNGSIGNPPKNSENDLPEWVNKKPIVPDTKDIATSTITCNNKKYKLFSS